MGGILVRQARPGDGDALIRIHADVARYYIGLGPAYFRLPGLGGFVRELDAAAQAANDGMLRLVAEADGEVVGALVARLLQPGQGGEREVTQSLEVPRLRIDYLATAADRRRQGAGTLLVEAAEAWGRQAGAKIAETTAYRGSPLSVPFWEDRMGYEERSVNLRKPL